MQRYTSVQNNITAFLLGISVLFLVGIGGYWAGYEVYSTHYDVWEWYRNFLMGIIPTLGLVATWYFGYSARFAPRQALSTLYFWAMIGSLGFTAMYVVWEIVIWRECNDKNGFIFVHPHCANPNYPVETTPKMEFFLTFFGAALCGLAQVVCIMFSEQITCAGAYAGAVSMPSYSERAVAGNFYQDTNASPIDSRKYHKGSSSIGSHFGKKRRSSSSDDDDFEKQTDSLMEMEFKGVR